MRTHWNMERGGLKSTNVGGTSAFPLVEFCRSLAIIISENPTSEDPFFWHVGYCIKLKMQQVKTTFFVLCFFFLPVYWLKHIFGSITSEASIKSITSIFFFFLQIKFENFLMDLSVLPLGIIMLICFIYGHYFYKHYNEHENEKSLLILLCNASFFHCKVT